MVRLKAILILSIFSNKKFQFHYGTIKSLIPLLPFVFFDLFQFHYGTIKRHNHEAWSGFHADFNSIMVRLKVYEELKNQVINLFQFHYGTIKSPYLLTTLAHKNDFNSIMVRLKG